MQHYRYKVKLYLYIYYSICSSQLIDNYFLVYVLDKINNEIVAHKYKMK